METRSVKAVVFGGGKGRRLRPLTYYFQKVMIPIGSRQKPLLEYIVKLLKYYGFTDILLLVGYKYEQVVNYFEDGSRFGVHIDYVVDEPGYSGTGGALLNAYRKGKFSNVEHILIYYGDILSKIDLRELYSQHVGRGADATLAIASKYQVPVGIVETGSDNRVLRMIEKPWMPLKVTIGVLMLKSKTLYYLEKLASTMEGSGAVKIDIMGDLIPYVIESGGRVYAYEYHDLWFDVGTTEKYEKLDPRLIDEMFKDIL